MKKSLFLITTVVMALSSPVRADLNMFFSTNNMSTYSDTDVWITIQRGQDPSLDTSAANVPQVNYGGTAFTWTTYTNVVGTGTQVGSIFSDSVRLSDIIAAGGITWQGNAPSAAIYVSYGTNFPSSLYSLSGPNPANPTDPSYNTPYQNFEITYNGGAADQGDMTAINFFGAAMKISSYSSTNATGTPLQAAGFNASTETIYNQLKGIGGSSAVLTNGTGQVTRVLGPSDFGVQPNGNDYGSYPSFNNYFSNMVTKNNVTTLSNFSGYNTIAGTIPSNATYSNANATFILQNTVTTNAAGYGLQATGNIVIVTSAYTNGVISGSTTQTFSNVTLNVTPVPQTGTNILGNVASSFVYYGNNSPGTNNIYMSGAGWTSAAGYLSSNNFVDGSGNAAASILQAQMFGELASAFADGFVGSTNVVAQYAGALGTLPSGDWWNLTNIVAFSDIQSQSNFYNAYADIIYQNSSNTVYGMVYSDRFTSFSPFVSSSPDVGSWMVDLFDPITSSVPEPAVASLAVAGLIGFAFFRTFFGKRRKLLGR